MDATILNQDITQLTQYLSKHHWLKPDQHIVALEKPGEGNMNLVLRVVPNKGSTFIVKQARPWVEKYPDLAAPVERIHVEYLYYHHSAKNPQLAKYSPEVLGFDRINNVLVMQDFSAAKDLTSVYKIDHGFNFHHIDEATRYLNHLRSIRVPDSYPSNLELRKLNHQHIFMLPFTENGFDLDRIQAGLEHLARACKNDQELLPVIYQLGSEYLKTGKFLLHGDFYPGSMLHTDEGFKVIDPEFSFAGPEEWDLAVFIAHLFLSGSSLEMINEACNRAIKTRSFNYKKFAGFVGIEILRRLIGLAQLPLALSLDAKAALLQDAVHWIKRGKIHTLSCYENHISTG